MKYFVKYNNPERHFIDFKLVVDTKNIHILKLQLPSWRPGRYELGNFAKTNYFKGPEALVKGHVRSSFDRSITQATTDDLPNVDCDSRPAQKAPRARSP